MDPDGGSSQSEQRNTSNYSDAATYGNNSFQRVCRYANLVK